MEEWVSFLSASDSRRVAQALELLGEALCADDEATRERAAEVLLAELAREGAVSQGPILQLLQLSWWPPPVKLAAPALAAVLTGVSRLPADAHEVDDAALLVANLYLAASLPLGALEESLGHARASVRKVAAGAVGRMGPGAVSLLPRLLPMLDDVEPVAGAALESLGSLAPAAPEVALPALFDQVARAEGARQYLALTSLRSLLEDRRREDHPALDLTSLDAVLSSMAEDPQVPIRLEAISLLGLGRLSSLTTVATLRRHLQDESQDVATCAAVALLRVGAPPQEAASFLYQQLMSGDAPAQADAALSLLEGLDAATLARIRDMLEAVAREARGPVRDTVQALLRHAAR
ncbi:hypothetical protein MYSTI_04006 [Myxococcus stipitatus DSM 14675]|uniref:HEAT repeat-containing PBS lyase n=1 Tax=Myxococcus stipitatus (strain DSM 14675 / JCM 12634 / Mx s8) TaxID=1278073 RepID=L7UCI4_MYXSD|nr:hypothetical protein MYSTI_04006 [Myxococcus stipitatus DSM 14675]